MANSGYNPGVMDVVKGPYLSDGAIDRTLMTQAVLNRGDIVVEDYTALDPQGRPTWRLADGTTDRDANLYGVTTPSDYVGAFAGNAFTVEKTGTNPVAGLGLVPALGPLGAAGVGSAPEAPRSPIGTSRKSATISDGAGGSKTALVITDGYFVVTATPLNIPGNEYRLSRIADRSISIGDFVDVDGDGNMTPVAASSGPPAVAAGRWRVVAGGPYYLNNLTTKSVGGAPARQGGVVDTINIVLA